MKPKAVIIADKVSFYSGEIIDYVYGPDRVEKIRVLTELHPVRVSSDNFESELPKLSEVEVIFSTWGIIPLSEKELDKMPNLKAVFYAGGSASGFAEPLLKRGITICNAVEANAIPVAEFCLAQIILACKNAYKNTDLCRKGPWDQSRMPVGKGAYGETVALAGIGAISRHLLKLLKAFNLRVIGVSGYLSHNPEEAKAMGIDKLVSIEQAFRESYIVSNHLPNKDTNKGIITAEHFASMREGATFINTGRGAQVDEAGMIEVLKARPDLTALLDVQHPEPPLAESELYSLPNVYMTSHIAGSANDEVQRMADFMLDDFKRWCNNEPLKFALDADAQSTRA